MTDRCRRIMPVALVPRPWDFTPKSTDPATPRDTSASTSVPDGGPTSIPLMVTPNGATSTANPEGAHDLPAVTVTPPTPPASQTLKTSTEEAPPTVSVIAAAA